MIPKQENNPFAEDIPHRFFRQLKAVISHGIADGYHPEGSSEKAGHNNVISFRPKDSGKINGEKGNAEAGSVPEAGGYAPVSAIFSAGT